MQPRLMNLIAFAKTHALNAVAESMNNDRRAAGHDCPDPDTLDHAVAGPSSVGGIFGIN